MALTRDSAPLSVNISSLCVREILAASTIAHSEQHAEPRRAGKVENSTATKTAASGHHYAPATPGPSHSRSRSRTVSIVTRSEYRHSISVTFAAEQAVRLAASMTFRSLSPCSPPQ